jgi:hypothetical protein
MKTQYKYIVVLEDQDSVWNFDTLKEAKDKAYSLIYLRWANKVTVLRQSYAGVTTTLGSCRKEITLKIKWHKGN